MRSISWKLLVAFVIVSLGGTLLFFVIARQYSNQEIRNFLFDQDQSRIATWLAEQYEVNGSWDNIRPPSQFIPAGGNSDGPISPFILVDQNMVVVQGPPSGMGGDFNVGDTVSEKDLIGAVEITLNGNAIGWLLQPAKGPSRSQWGHPILERLDDLLLISAGGAMVLALVLALVFSRSLSRPLQELSAAAQAAATGDLSQKVEVKTKDEIGLLAGSFNQMMEDLEKLISSRRQMTADIAHELRTPISVILGYTEGVHEGVIQPDKKTFEIVHDEALRLERLVKDLRLISQADVGELPLDLHPVDPRKLAEESVRPLEPILLEQGIQLESQIDPDLPEILIDKDRIMQVVRNILDNAIRHTPEGGRIDVRVGKDVTGFVTFTIQDSGPGVPPEKVSDIFNRFYRLDAARSRDQSGTGLGLAIAKAIIEQHGGEIHAESPLGEGLKVLFKLPIS